MSQRTFGRILVLVTLTLVLTLAGPLRAEASPQRIGPASLLGWLENLWQEGIGISVRQDLSAHNRNQGGPGALPKQGTCTDPNGCPNAPSLGGSGILCGTSGCVGSK
jgi:hypothetical protein